MDRQVLLLSSDQDTVSLIKRAFEPLGYEIILKQRLASGLRAIKGDELVLLDFSETASALKEIMSYHPDQTVLIIAYKDCIPQSMEEGAYDCVETPIVLARLELAVKNAFRYMALKAELGRLRSIEVPTFISDKNARMHKVVRQINRIMAKDTPVLISGEKGSGKRLVARMLHLGGRRKTGPFVQMERTGDLEARLFGNGSASGNILQAEGGTLFLENIAGLPPSLSVRLSSFIKSHKIALREGVEPVNVDVRVLCATNGVDREDPIFKNFAVEIKLPPLRVRKEDILPLAEHFLREASGTFRTGTKELAKDAKKSLLKYKWPGNVGELQNTIRKACLLSSDGIVNSSHLGLEDSRQEMSVGEFLEAKLSRYMKDNAGLHGTVMSEVEKSLIELVLKETGGNQFKAARALGINRTTLRTKIKNYRIDSKNKKSK
jgi:DNA-binding NtrC family response regulator